MPELQDYVKKPWLRIILGLGVWYFVGIEGSYPAVLTQWWGRILFGVIFGCALIVCGICGLAKQKPAPEKKVKIPLWLQYLIVVFLFAFGIWFVLSSVGLLGGGSNIGHVETPVPTAVDAKRLPTLTILEPSGQMKAVDFLSAFYEVINRAGNESDLNVALNYLGNLPRDSAFWWDFQVRYSVYECLDRNTFYVGLTYFYRDNNFTTARNDTPEVIRYTLDVVNNQWYFVDGREETGVSSSCTLAVTNWPD